MKAPAAWPMKAPIAWGSVDGSSQARRLESFSFPLAPIWDKDRQQLQARQGQTW